MQLCRFSWQQLQTSLGYRTHLLTATLDLCEKQTSVHSACVPATTITETEEMFRAPLSHVCFYYLFIYFCIISYNLVNFCQLHPCCWSILRLINSLAEIPPRLALPPSLSLFSFSLQCFDHSNISNWLPRALGVGGWRGTGGADKDCLSAPERAANKRIPLF